MRTAIGNEPGPVSAPPSIDVRLQVPRPHVVLVRVTGTVDGSTVTEFADAVAACFGAVLHVVVDLHGVTALARSGVRALLDLDRAATRRGTVLHVTGITEPRSGHVAGHLRRLADDHLLRVDAVDPVSTPPPVQDGPRPVWPRDRRHGGR